MKKSKCGYTINKPKNWVNTVMELTPLVLILGSILGVLFITII